MSAASVSDLVGLVTGSILTGSILALGEYFTRPKR